MHPVAPTAGQVDHVTRTRRDTRTAYAQVIFVSKILDLPHISYIAMTNEYSEAHRVLLTYIRGVKCISAEELVERFVMIADHFGIDMADPTQAMRDYIAEINVKIARAYFKIDSIRDQETDMQQYVFINTKFDEIIQGCTPYSPPELDAIKQLIDSIVNSHGYAFGLPFGNAKQQITTVLKRPPNELENFIERLVDDGWINLTAQKRLVLSAASLSELADYLQDRYGEFSDADTLGKLLKCLVCSGFVTLGKKCSNTECPSSFHAKCFSVFSRDNKVCPNSLCSEPVASVIDIGTKSTVGDRNR